MLKNFIRIALVKETYSQQTDMAEDALLLLNRSSYKELRELIDLEKKELEYQDLKDFAAIG